MIEARDTGAPETGRPAGGRDFLPEDDSKRGRRKKKRSPKLLWGAVAGAVVVVAAAAAGAVVLTGGDDGEGAATGLSNGPGVLPTAYTPQMADRQMARIAQRSADQRPMTQGEVFSNETKTVTYQNYSFTLAGSQLSGDCKSVTWGQRLHDDLAKAGCSQIARGIYVSQDRKYVGQFAAINLASQEGADQIVRVMDPATKSGFVLPLLAPGAPKFGGGFSAAYAQAYGHYTIVTWVQRAGGARPASLNEMIDISLAVEKPADFVWGRLPDEGNGR
ncbi:hypothetical protein [Actinomadura sp. NBRC 104425]|uniref:hypothetical protein n=1 Tax=Actinomadura sp. NBRC 104425 TaxID=3032204 RepID=UPI00255763F8|nr:hypothetical protein [Actinomadura sp. NBRC 104425]